MEAEVVSRESLDWGARSPYFWGKKLSRKD